LKAGFLFEWADTLKADIFIAFRRSYISCENLPEGSYLLQKNRIQEI